MGLTMTDLNVDYRHPAWGEFKDEWDMVGDCVDGERKIKQQGYKYLPHPSDDAADDDPQNQRYASYKARAPFINVTGRTLTGLVGIAFNKPVKITLEGGVAGLEADADGEGQPLAQFVRDALNQNLQRGRAGILTDHTGNGEQRGDSQPRPVLQLFTATQIINWRVTANKTSLVVLHWQEPVDDPDGFALQLCRRWMELRLIDGVACFRRWEESESGIVTGALTAFTDAGGRVLNELPWSWIGAVNNDHTPDAPPLADIAYINIKHYQCEADLAEAAHTVGQPMVALTGLSQEWIDTNFPDGGFCVGSRRGVMLPVNSDMKFAQPEERGIMTSLAERRENQMAMLGARLVERNGAARTATQAASEAQTDNSVLSLCAGNVEQAVNRALSFAAQFAGGSGSIELSKQYDIAQLDSQAITALVAAVQAGQMRLIDFIRYQQRTGLIGDDDAPEDILQELKDREPTFTGLNDGNNQ